MEGARMKRTIVLVLFVGICVFACSTLSTPQAVTQKVLDATPIITETVPISTTTPLPTQSSTPIPPTDTPTLVPTPRPVPAFKHIVILIFENKEFGFVIGNSQMPNYNRLARENTLFTQQFAIMHPSLPNYLALIGGDTFEHHQEL